MTSLTAAVAAFRAAMDSGVLRHLVQFERFPRGACGDTSLLLARWLAENGFGKWAYFAGRRGKQTHAWVERDGTVIDITADQFEDGPGPVVITRDRRWHDQFEGKPDELNADDLEQPYQIVAGHISRCTP